MTPKEFEDKMREIYKGDGSYEGDCADYDEEHCHQDADTLMEITLRELGYGKGIEIFDRARKWYS